MGICGGSFLDCAADVAFFGWWPRIVTADFSYVLGHPVWAMCQLFVFPQQNGCRIKKKLINLIEMAKIRAHSHLGEN